MPDKPKTYAQQAQELKEQLATKDQIIEQLKEQFENYTGLDAQVEKLEAELAGYRSTAQQSGVSNKAQLTDAVQRAESAEQGLRNAQARISELEINRQALESQLNVAAIERDSASGRADKVTALTEQFKNERLQFANQIERLNERKREDDARIADLERQANFYRQKYTEAYEELTNIKLAIRSAPDPLAELRNSI